MSYHQDHMAWQQRVGLEMHAHRKNLDKVLAGGVVYPSNSLYDFYQSILAEQQQSRTPGQTQSRPSSSVFCPQNKHAYTFGGKTNVRKANQGSNPVLAQQNVINDYQLQSQQSRGSRRREDDTLSKSSSAYVGRSQRHLSASTASKPSQATRTYYPEQYFKRVGYPQPAPDQLSQRSQASRGSRRVDALGQRVRERFNEELAYPAEQKKVQGLKAKNLAKCGGGGDDGSTVVLSRKSGDIQSRVQSAIASRRQVMRTDNNKSAMKREQEEVESIITKENLKQFNQNLGTVAGNAAEEIEQVEAEMQDQVEDLEENKANEKDLSQAPSRYTQATYIRSLQDQLNEEKVARMCLEDEIMEIKRINQEISSKLALTSHASDMAQAQK